MSKLTQYLQEHLRGEVTDSLEARRYFSTDASPLKIQPTCVIYPRGTDDVRKVMRFAWQLAQREHKMSVTARGNGRNTTGAAIGPGIVMIMPKHLNRILELNPRRRGVRLEPGIQVDKLQQALFTHGLFLPAGSSLDGSTIAGLIASNASGGRVRSSGAIGQAVNSLEVVLANGEVTITGPLSRADLSQKLGLSSFEGDVYRELDALLEECAGLIKEARPKFKSLKANASGYNIFDISGENGEFNLTPLMVGSQGTLGIITEASLSLEPYTPPMHGCLISLGRLRDLTTLLPKLLDLEPARIDFVNHAMVEQVTKLSPNYFNDIEQLPSAALHLWLEFDDQKEARQAKSIEEAGRLAAASGADFQLAAGADQLEILRKVVNSHELLSVAAGAREVPLPLADAAVPPSQLESYLDKIYFAFKSVDAPAAVWGNAAAGVVHVQLPVDLAQLGDRQRLFKLAEAVQQASLSSGGTSSAADGDGRMRADKIQLMYGKKLYEIMAEIKKIFDPHGILNTGVKFGTSEKDVKMLLNNSYNPHGRLD